MEKVKQIISSHTKLLAPVMHCKLSKAKLRENSLIFILYLNVTTLAGFF